MKNCMENYLCSEAVLQRCSPIKMLCKPTVEQQYRTAISTKALYNFSEITPTHRCTAENLQHICRTPSSRRTPLWHVKRILRDLNYEKFLFTLVKINLLTLKMNKETNK